MRNKLNRLSLLGASFIALSGVSATILSSCGASSTPVEIKTIDVERKPNKLEYIVGEKLDLTGIVVHRVMADGTWKVLDKSEYTTVPAEGEVLKEVNASLKVKVMLAENPDYYQEFPICVSEDPTPIIEQTGKVVYEAYEDGYKVTGLSNASDKIKYVTVENTYEGKKVLQIDEGAFANCPNMTKLNLPFIGKSRDATGKEALFGWVFGETMFEGCGGYTWQEYDVEQANETVTEYGSFCIPTSVEEVNITDATQIPAGAFSKCRYLSTVTINDFNGTNIGNKAFYNCTGIHSFNINGVKGLTNIEHHAFLGCATLQYINLPSTVTTIGDEAFAYCVSCSRANIPSSVTSVGSKAFSSVSGVILVEASEEDTKSWAEDWTESKTPVVYDYGEESSIGYDKDWFVMVCGKENNKYGYLVQWMGSWEQTEITIPSTLTINGQTLPIKIIGGRCFEENTFLNHVIIEEGLEQIFADTFKGCTHLKYVDFPDSLTTIRDEAFYKCSSLVGHYENGTPVNSIDLENVTTVGARAFSECTSMLDLNLKNVVTIGDEAFAYCTHLCPDTTDNPDNCLLIPATCTKIGEGAFKYCFKYAPDTVTASIYYPTVLFAEGNQITEIPDNCFEFCGVRVTKPTTGWDAGVQYPKQLRVNINLNGAELTEIGDYAFSNCWIASLKGARNTHIKRIGDYAFYYAQMTSDTSPTSESKADLQMDQEMEYIGDYAFAYCTTIQSLTFNTDIDKKDGSVIPMGYNELKHLGDRAFYACSNQDFNDLDLSPCIHLRSSDWDGTEEDPEPTWFQEKWWNYPDYTPRYAFAYCSNLKNVWLPGSGHNPKVVIPEGDKVWFNRLPERFFEGCTNLGSSGTALVLPENINQIAYAACNACTYLQKVVIEGTINYMGSSIFNNNYNLVTVEGKDGGNVKFDEAEFNNSRVGSYIYNNCYKLEKAPMPIYTPTDESTAIQFSLREQMYYQNKVLGTINIPYNCYSIGTRTFMYCEKLTTVTFDRRSARYGDCNTLNAYAFSNCKALTSINIEDTNMGAIYGSVFENCNSLTSIKLPSHRSVAFYNKPFEGWSPTGGATVKFVIGNQTLKITDESKKTTTTWTTETWPYDDQTKWPERFVWRANASSSWYTFTRKGSAGSYYYTCDNDACGGSDGSIHFEPYQF